MCHSAHYMAQAPCVRRWRFRSAVAPLPPLRLARDLHCVLYAYHDEYVIIQIVVNPCHSDIIHETLNLKLIYIYFYSMYEGMFVVFLNV